LRASTTPSSINTAYRSFKGRRWKAVTAASRVLPTWLTVAALITRIHDHCLVANQKNLASCLRVVCLKYINVCY